MSKMERFVANKNNWIEELKQIAKNENTKKQQISGWKLSNNGQMKKKKKKS